ncbi:hypothetical protein B0H14DRAFT_2935216, partial [Mycena olivaceomarginata]
HETASSAVRTLDGYKMDGRALRCSLADSDPYLEGKTTVRGEIVPTSTTERWKQRRTDDRGPDGSEILAKIPAGKPLGADEKAQDAITYAIAHMDRSRLIEVLAQMKAFVITYPKRARQFLSHHPQVAYAVVMGLLTSKTIPENILSPPMLEGSHDAMREATLSAPPPSQNFGPPPPQHQHQAYPPSPSRLQQPKLVQGMMPPGMAAPSPGVMFGQTMQPMRPPPYQQPQPSQAASYQLQNGSGDAQNAQTSHSIVLTPMPTPITELTAAQVHVQRKMLLANRG